MTTQPATIRTHRDPEANRRLIALLLPELLKPAPTPAAQKAS